MPSGPGERYDFFLSRRGSVASIAQEVADVSALELANPAAATTFRSGNARASIVVADEINQSMHGPLR
jgi:hypothetical protein